jgi:lipid-binding SYLF domain-containing protein
MWILSIRENRIDTWSQFIWVGLFGLNHALSLGKTYAKHMFLLRNSDEAVRNLAE